MHCDGIVEFCIAPVDFVLCVIEIEGKSVHMASVWDALRADTVVSLLLSTAAFDEPTSGSGAHDALPGIGVMMDGSFGYGYIQKHFDAVKGSLALFGGHRLVVEANGGNSILVGILAGEGEGLLIREKADLEALQRQIRAAGGDGSASSVINMRTVSDSFLRAAKEAFKAANGLPTEGDRLMGGGGVAMGLPSIPQVEGMSAADNLRLMMTLQALEGEAGASVKPAPPASQVELLEALDAVTVDALGVAIPSDPPCGDLTSQAVVLYSNLLALCGAVSARFAELATAKAHADGKELADGLALFVDEGAFLAAVISHQRRYLSNPGALGPRVAFPLSVFDQCLVYANNAGALSEAFKTLRREVEFSHLVESVNGVGEDALAGDVDDEGAFEALMKQASAPPATYYTTLRVL